MTPPAQQPEPSAAAVEERMMTAAHFKSAREKLGLTQAAMSKLLGCGEKSYTRWENGAAPTPIVAKLLKFVIEEPEKQKEIERALEYERAAIQERDDLRQQLATTQLALAQAQAEKERLKEEHAEQIKSLHEAIGHEQDRTEEAHAAFRPWKERYLSALAACESRDATLKRVREYLYAWRADYNKCYNQHMMWELIDKTVAIRPDSDALRKHDAEITGPLVEALQHIYTLGCLSSHAQAGERAIRIADAAIRAHAQKGEAGVTKNTGIQAQTGAKTTSV